MALNRLLWYCLNHGTSLRENNVGVSIAPIPGEERVVFFKVDTDDFKRYFNVGADTKVCDGLIFYRKRGESPLFIFVELKSDDINDAEDQIESTYRIVHEKVPRLHPPAVFKGLIILRSGVPRSVHRRDSGGKKIERKTIIPIEQKGGVKGKNAELRACGVL
jgi:hypothetical protein